jgi:hypothetical protein
VKPIGTEGSNVFDWLEQEIRAIKTPRFHLVDGPADLRMRQAVTASKLPLPAPYREFVLKFGNAKLYRTGITAYRIGVFAGPREKILMEGTRFYQIGFHGGASVCVLPTAQTAGSPIYELESGVTEKAGDDFAEWLARSCARAKDGYGLEKWAEILRGPAPFTPEEEQILEARRQIRWRMVGIDADGNHVFEISNTGRRTLPVLTVGVRSRDKRLNGAVFLRIGHVGPGETAVLHADCYKDLRPPEDIEVFALPDPQPEDREEYGEFGHA